jgi:hypothetical protein
MITNFKTEKMKKNLQELSNEVLLKQAKNTRFVFGIFIGIILVKIVSGIITTLE